MLQRISLNSGVDFLLVPRNNQLHLALRTFLERFQSRKVKLTSIFFEFISNQKVYGGLNSLPFPCPFNFHALIVRLRLRVDKRTPQKGHQQSSGKIICVMSTNLVHLL